jgi:hypothetical protein
VRISKRTTYQIDKILDRRIKRGIVEYLVKWRGYNRDFNSWVPASSVQNIKVRCGCNMTDRQEKHVYVTLFSNASQELYPTNSLSKFRVELAKPIVLNSIFDCEVGLCEFSCVPIATGTIRPSVVVGDVTALIYCNIISPQFVGGDLLRCLRTYIQRFQACNFNFETVYYMPVEKKTFQNIHIKIVALDGTRVKYQDNDEPTKLVFHFVVSTSVRSFIYNAMSKLYNFIL